MNPKYTGEGHRLAVIADGQERSINQDTLTLTPDFDAAVNAMLDGNTRLSYSYTGTLAMLTMVLSPVLAKHFKSVYMRGVLYAERERIN